MTNIATDNPNHKWRFSSLGKTSISMGHGFHGYVKLPDGISPCAVIFPWYLILSRSSQEVHCQPPLAPARTMTVTLRQWCPILASTLARKRTSCHSFSYTSSSSSNIHHPSGGRRHRRHHHHQQQHHQHFMDVWIEFPTSKDAMAISFAQQRPHTLQQRPPHVLWRRQTEVNGCRSNTFALRM